MGFATHLGPWLLGTVKDTTGTTVGTIRNTGTTAVTQTKPITFANTTETTAFVLPAGAIVREILLYTDVAAFNGTTPTVTIRIGGLTLGTITPTSGTAGIYSMTLTPGVLAVAIMGNVSAATSPGLDGLFTMQVSGTSVTAGSGDLVINYSVRGPDGAGFPAQS